MSSRRQIVGGGGLVQPWRTLRVKADCPLFVFPFILFSILSSIILWVLMSLKSDAYLPNRMGKTCGPRACPAFIRNLLDKGQCLKIFNLCFLTG